MLSVEVTDGRTAGCINIEYIGFPFESRRIPAAFVTPAGGACDTISWVSRLRSQTFDNTIPSLNNVYTEWRIVGRPAYNIAKTQEFLIDIALWSLPFRCLFE